MSEATYLIQLNKIMMCICHDLFIVQIEVHKTNPSNLPN